MTALARIILADRGAGVHAEVSGLVARVDHWNRGVDAAVTDLLAVDVERGGASFGEPALDEILVGVDAYLELFEDPGPDERALLVTWGSTFRSNASVEGMANVERRSYGRSYEGLSQRIASGQDEGPFGRTSTPRPAPCSLHGLMRGVAALLLSDRRPGGHARRPPDLSRMDRLGLAPR